MAKLCRQLGRRSFHGSRARLENEGVCWPLPVEGALSTTVVGKRIWNAAIAGMSERGNVNAEKCSNLINDIKEESNWRHQYGSHLHKMALLMVENSNSAFAQASTGLTAIYSEFVFQRSNKIYKLNGLLNQDSDIVLNEVTTLVIKGNLIGRKLVHVHEKVTVPIQIDKKFIPLTGNSLIKQAEAWAEYGCCEATVSKSIAAVANLTKEELPIQGRIFCMLGGTSEVCPSRPLLALGATVAVIARPGEKLDSLVEYASTTQGKLLIPQLAQADRPGLNIITHTPEVAKWLRSVSELKEEGRAEALKLCIGSYIYLDGEQHVRASVAMDIVCTSLAEELGPQRVAIAQLTSPMTSHIWPPEALANSEERWMNRSWLARFAQLKQNGGDRVGIPDNSNRKVFNGTIVAQGPNYALAKILQLWRCIVARKNGQTVSANFAPPARTVSVLHGKLMGTAINGMQAIDPWIVLDAPTASSFMTALLLSDLLPSSSSSNPADPAVSLDHPWDLFTYNSFTGGNWRCAYYHEDIFRVFYILGLMKYETGTVKVVIP